MAKVTFAARHPWDSGFWALFVASSWLVVLLGFWPPVSQRFFGQADYEAPLILVLHVFIYTGWMLLLTLQPTLIAMRRVDWHRRIGLAGIVLAVLVPVTGIAAEVFSQRFYAQRDPDNVRFFIIPLMMAVGFAIFAALAIAARRDPPTHKRAMFLATAFIVTGPYARSWGTALEQTVGAGPLGTAAHWLTGLNVMLAGLVIYDLLTRGAVYPFVRRSLIAIIPIQFFVIWTWYSDWWPELARIALGISAP